MWQLHNSGRVPGKFSSHAFGARTHLRSNRYRRRRQSPGDVEQAATRNIAAGLRFSDPIASDRPLYLMSRDFESSDEAI
jgi:hypothetical protein